MTTRVMCNVCDGECEGFLRSLEDQPVAKITVINDTFNQGSFKQESYSIDVCTTCMNLIKPGCGNQKQIDLRTIAQQAIVDCFKKLRKDNES